MLAHDGDNWHILLVRRGKEPFQGRWALPGGKVGADEDATTAARRELQEETGLRATDTELIPLSWRTSPDRDPRGRYVSLVYAALLPQPQQVHGGGDAAAAWWQPLPVPPRGFPDPAAEQHFAFDHAAILRELLPAAPHGRSAVPHIREATAADGQEIRRLLKSHALGDGAAGHPATGGLGPRTHVAALGSFLVGCAGLPPNGDPAAKDRILVHPRWQGRGIEQELAAVQAQEHRPP
ncbi:NUDIX domain-containing protein [Streptomyces pathocidini]|uniref:8-AzgC n=1 Tax=Streptomyces pathocidini TaxID=1650571 RepID=A0A6G9KI21_9ACTN|nr:NUDIX domain-containing protein [Streptomyces pathocidini]QIQ51169.1 PtnD [Streptomyces pathocidini]QLM04710.1 8-AzgC [Streptomyces pathocidini]